MNNPYEAQTCPHCAQPVWMGAARGFRIGSPFHECPGCRALLAHPTRNEWDLLEPSARLRLVGSVALLGLCLGLVPGLLFLLWTWWQASTIQPWPALAWIGVGSVAAWLWRGGELARAVSRSRHRMADPMYRARLVEFGRARSRPQATSSSPPPG